MVNRIIHGTLFKVDLLFILLYIIFSFKLVSYMLISLFLHELGHYLACLLLNIRVLVFRLSIFSSYVEFSSDNITPIKHIVISIAGPLFNLIMIILAIILNQNSLFIINLIFFLLNLIPTKGTDGSIILMNFINILKFKNYEKLSNKIGIIISTIIFIIFLINNKKIINYVLFMLQ
jgi:stage IV sporulation protein FB